MDPMRTTGGGLRLQRIEDLDSGEEVLFGSSLSVGRHPLCDLVLDDPRISGRHAAVEWDGERWVVYDLGSTNGTRLNGARIRRRESLKSGDVLQFGGVARWRVSHLSLDPMDGSGLDCTADAKESLDSVSAVIHVHLAETAPERGRITITHLGKEWSVDAGKRFQLLGGLGRRANQWVARHEVAEQLWGRTVARSLPPEALAALVADVRRVFDRGGVAGWLVEENEEQQRLRLPPERVVFVERTRT